MSANAPTPSGLIDERLRRDLRATIRLNLTMVGVWLSDDQLAGLVEAFVARLEGEWRVRQTPPPPSDPARGPA